MNMEPKNHKSFGGFQPLIFRGVYQDTNILTSSGCPGWVLQGSNCSEYWSLAEVADWDGGMKDWNLACCSFDVNRNPVIFHPYKSWLTQNCECLHGTKKRRSETRFGADFWTTFIGHHLRNMTGIGNLSINFPLELGKIPSTGSPPSPTWGVEKTWDF